MQLTLFDNYQRDNHLSERASDLLKALNEGRREHERYEAFAYYQEKGKIVLLAQNKGHLLGNIVDLDGNTPEGFSACWRIPQHILNDMKE